MKPLIWKPGDVEGKTDQILEWCLELQKQCDGLNRRLHAAEEYIRREKAGNQAACLSIKID